MSTGILPCPRVDFVATVRFGFLFRRRCFAPGIAQAMGESVTKFTLWSLLLWHVQSYAQVFAGRCYIFYRVLSPDRLGETATSVYTLEYLSFYITEIEIHSSTFTFLSELSFSGGQCSNKTLGSELTSPQIRIAD